MVKSLYHRKHLKAWNYRFRPGDIPIYLLFLVFALLTIYPFWYVLVGSFSHGTDYLNGGVYLWPRQWTLRNYLYILLDKRFYSSLGVTVARTVLSTILSTVFTAMVGYAMSIRNTPFRKTMYIINIITLFFGGGLIPYFILLVNLGFYDNFLVYIIPGLYSAFNMIIFSNFFSRISKDLRESALMDGANEFTIIFRIYFPISTPIFATVMLWTAVGNWNAYYDTMLYSSSQNMWTLQYYLLTMIKQLNSPPELMGNINFGEEIVSTTVSDAAIVISSVIILAFYPLILKAFKRGQTMGSLKE